MYKSFKLNFLRFKRRSKLRTSIRTFASLVRNSQEGTVEFYKQLLVDSNLSIQKSSFSKLIYGESNSDRNLMVLKHFLFYRLLRVDINQQILLGLAGKKILFPMPMEWRIIFSNWGFSLSIFSLILWRAYVALLYLYGVYTILILIGEDIKQRVTWNRKNELDDAYVYFVGMQTGNVIDNGKECKKYTTINWFIEYFKRNNKKIDIRHSVGNNLEKYYFGEFKICVQKECVPNFNEFTRILKFMLWGICAIVYSFFNMLLGRWWNVVMLSEGARRERVYLAKSSELAKIYYFSNTNFNAAARAILCLHKLFFK